MSSQPLRSSGSVAQDLVRILCATKGLNEFFETALPLISEAFGARRAVLIDYHENTNHFDVLHFRLTYTNAGHFEPALIRRDGALERFQGGGPPLGMFRDSKYPGAEKEIRPGDLLLLFTDGLTDLCDAEDQYFGEEKILKAVGEHRTRPLREIASAVLSEGMSFSASPHPEDDLTLLMMRFR